MILLDIFSGAGGAGLGYAWAGFDRVIGVDVIDFADYYSVVGEFHRMKWEAGLEKFAGMADMIHASPPCFPAETPVVTLRGVIPIERVLIGDEVLTHQLRWRKVSDVMSRQAPVVQYGSWMRCTPDHLFLATRRASTGTLYSPSAGKPVRGQHVSSKEPEWVPASGMAGLHVAAPSEFPSATVPPVAGFKQDEFFWWTVGRWVGDGWTRIEEARKRYEVIICSSYEEQMELEVMLNLVQEHPAHAWVTTFERTTCRFSLRSRELATWLRSNFGHGASEKTLPAWIFGMDWDDRISFLRGYLSADGYERKGKYLAGSFSVGTVSPCLAIGMRLLATSLRFGTGMNLHKPKRTAVIEGRVVNERPSWYLGVTQRDRYGIYQDGMRWSRMRGTPRAAGTERVYDLTVEEDHSFIAWGYVVHNCHRYSQMTKSRPGLPETKPDYVAAVREALIATGKPYVIENVQHAPLLNPTVLCCWSFGYQTYRHRLFETSHPIRPKEHFPHTVPGSRSGHWEPGTFISVAGHCSPIAKAREVMAINWMRREELVEAIPPYMTQYIGREMIRSAGIR